MFENTEWGWEDMKIGNYVQSIRKSTDNKQADKQEFLPNKSSHLLHVTFSAAFYLN